MVIVNTQARPIKIDLLRNENIIKLSYRLFPASTLPTKQFNQISAATRTRGASTRRRCWTSGATRPRRVPAGSTSSGGSARPRPPPSPTWASPTPAGQREHIISLLYLRKG